MIPDLEVIREEGTRVFTNKGVARLGNSLIIQGVSYTIVYIHPVGSGERPSEVRLMNETGSGISEIILNQRLPVPNIRQWDKYDAGIIPKSESKPPYVSEYARRKNLLNLAISGRNP